MADVKRAVAGLAKTVGDLYLRGKRLGTDYVTLMQSTVAEMHATMRSLERSPALKREPGDYAKEISRAGGPSRKSRPPRSMALSAVASAQRMCEAISFPFPPPCATTSSDGIFGSGPS